MIRGISEETLNKYRVDDLPHGYDFPIWDSFGRRVGTSINNLDPDKVKYCHLIADKYKHRGIGYMYNEQILPTLFYGKPVIVVEGNWDLLALAQAGLPAVAALTNNLRVPVIKKLKRYTNKIILWMDNDVDGEDGVSRTSKRLDSFQMYYRVFRSNAGKDPNEILMKKPEEFKKIIDELKGLLECLR